MIRTPAPLRHRILGKTVLGVFQGCFGQKAFPAGMGKANAVFPFYR